MNRQKPRHWLYIQMTHMKDCACDWRDRESRNSNNFYRTENVVHMSPADLDKSISTISCSSLLLAASKSPWESYPFSMFYLIYFKKELNRLQNLLSSTEPNTRFNYWKGLEGGFCPYDKKKNSFRWSWSFHSYSHIFNAECNKAFSTNSQSTLPAVAFSLPQNNSVCSAVILVFN